MSAERYLCPFAVAGSVCILDDWHEGSHVVVDEAELAA